MYRDLSEFFTKNLTIPIDKELYDNIESYRQQWIARSVDHIEFLSGYLFGTRVIKFTDTDTDALFYDIMGVDKEVLQKELYKVYGINPKFKVSSSIFNQTMVYLIRYALFGKDIPMGNRENYARICFYLFSYRVLSSLLVHRFRYMLDERTGVYVYEQLSEHYLIKKLGSWQAVIDYRANDFVNRDGLYYPRVKEYKTKPIVDTINDAQGRYRTMVNNLFRITMEIKNHGDFIDSQSLSQIDSEGQVGIRDIESKQTKMVDTIKTILFIKEDLIKEDYIHLIKTIVKSVNEYDLANLLEAVADVTDTEEKKMLMDMVGKVIYFSNQYLIQKKMDRFNSGQLVTVLKALKNFWMASKVPNKEILEIRKVMDKKIYKYIDRVYRNKIAGIRTGFFLYLFLLGYILSK